MNFIDKTSDFLHREWGKLLLFCAMCLIYFFSYFQRIAVPGTCFDELQGDFSASAAAVTALGSIFLYVYGFAQFFVGMAADRFGGQRTMLAGAAILSGASLVFPFSHSLPMLYITRAILAAGASMIFISLAKEIDTLFNPRHFAVWLGIALLLGYSGGIAGTYPFERAIVHFGWRNSMLWAGILCLFALIAASVIFRRFPSGAAQGKTSKISYLGRVLRNPLSYPPTVAGAINFAIYLLFQCTLAKKMLTDCCHVSSSRAAAVTFAMMIACTVSASLSGFVSRLIGNRRKPVILAGVLLTLSMTIMLACAMRGSPDYRIISAGLVMLGIAASPSPLVLTATKEINPAPAAATSMGMANFAAYVAVAVIINIAGVVMDCFNEQAVVTTRGILYPVAAYRLILAGCAFLSMISLIAARFIRETRGQAALPN